MIKVKRLKDGQVFTSSMSDDNLFCILEIHFCTSYTQVEVYDRSVKPYKQSTVICDPIDSVGCWIDMITVIDDDRGVFI